MKRLSIYRYLFQVEMVFLTLLVSVGPGCKKFIEVDAPTTDLIASTVYTSDEKATATVTAIYSEISGSGFSPGANQSFSLVSALSADEMADYSIVDPQSEFFANAISITNSTNLALWRSSYQYIFQANAVLEGLPASTGVSDAAKQALTGEAKFLRAFLYFWLVNYWGDVPYITNTDYKANASLPRTPQSEVFKEIIADLQDAQQLLPANDASGQKIRATRWAAKALLARVYLYVQDWENASLLSTELISASGAFSLVADLDKVFLANSAETIWQLMPVIPNYNSSEGYNYILTAMPSSVALNSQFVNSFESGDLRKDRWIGTYMSGTQSYYFPYKYKVKSSLDLTEYSIVLRLSEQYLIRAEARAHQNKLTGSNSAAEDLNAVRSRAGLADIGAVTEEQMLDAVQQERKSELFTEWGHRWLDLKRTNKADSVIAAVKGSQWQPTDKLYPIPQVEIQNDGKLTQNAGY